MDALFKTNEIVYVCGRTGSGKSTLLRTIRNNHPDSEIVLQNPDNQIVTDTVFDEFLSTGADKKRVAELSAYFGLGGIINQSVKNLSGGEKQLLAIAVALVNNPQILILDEPFSMLDDVASKRLVGLLLGLRKDFGITIIFASHEYESLYDASDRVIYMENGLIMYNGNKEEAAPFVRNIFDIQYVAPDKSVTDKVLLEAKNVRFGYTKHDHPIVLNVSLKLHKGEIIVIYGENGCGKSTLLKLLAGIMKPYEGKVIGKDNTAMLSQDVTDHFTLSEYDGRNPYALSGGEQQKLALDIVLSRNKEVLLLDEPTKGLDSFEKSELLRRLNEIKRKCGIIMVTHDREFAKMASEEIYLMFNGELIKA